MILHARVEPHSAPQRRTLFRICVFSAIALVFIFSWYSFIQRPYSGPAARDGVIDLTRHDMESKGPAYLEGELRFYPSAFLSLEELEGHAYSYVDGMGWNKALVDGEPYGPVGYGTYHITILPPEGDAFWVLDTPYFPCANVAYANGVEIGRAGVIATDPDHIVTSLVPIQYIIPVQGEPIELILHIANAEFPRGGMFHPPALCTPKQSINAMRINYSVKTGFSVLLLTIGALAVFLYFQSLSESGLYLFGGASVAATLVLFFEARHLITLPGYWSSRMACLGMGLMAFFLYMLFDRICDNYVKHLPGTFLRTLFGKPASRIGGAILLVCAVFFTAFLPLMQTRPLNMVVISIWGVATALTIIRVYLCAYFAKGRLDAYMISAICYACAAVMDMLGTKKYTLFFFNPSTFGGIAMMLVLFIVVARQYIETSKRLAQWNEELESRVHARTGELNSANRQLMQAEKRQRETFETIAHDLRAPVSAAMGAMELLSNIEIPSEHQSIMQIAQSRIAQLSEMVSELFRLTKIESGYMNLERMPHDLESVSQQIVEYYRSELQFTHHGLHLQYDHPSHPPIWILLDYDRLVEITDNLLANAIRYTREGGTIRMGYHLEEGAATYYVQDDGPGVAPDRLDRIFDRFYRAEDGNGMGAGLGLSIVRSIVHLHGGRIWAENRPEGGLRISFSLPLLPEEERQK